VIIPLLRNGSPFWLTPARQPPFDAQLYHSAALHGIISLISVPPSRMEGHCMKKFAAACFAAWLCLALCACAGKNDKPAPERAAVESGERQFAAPAEGDLIAIFDTSLGEVRAVLYPDAAPMAVENFAGLARTGYYDGTVIWRSEYGFAVQGGDA